VRPLLQQRWATAERTLRTVRFRERRRYPPLRLADMRHVMTWSTAHRFDLKLNQEQARRLA
jgi:hypothetical protein